MSAPNSSVPTINAPKIQITSASSSQSLNKDTLESTIKINNANSDVEVRFPIEDEFPGKPVLFSGAPLARIEKLDDDDDIDNREVVTKAYPGVDDGFFSNDDDERKSANPDVELVPTHPKDPETPEDEKQPDHNNPPSLVPRLGPDGDDNQPSDDPDGKTPMIPSNNVPRRGFFPFAPGFMPNRFDIEVGSNPDIPESIPDLNVYQHKKTLAQGMMDLALFSANANQLRYVLETFRNHPYYYPSLVLISLSLILQIAVGIGLIWNAMYNVKNTKALCLANKINNFTVIGIFLITIINVFISAFGVAPESAT